MKLYIPENVQKIIDIFYSNGYEAFIVGGCVRDSILDKDPNDYDITTNATPEEVIKIFNKYKTIPTGIKHGTITLIIDNESYEITTYRIEGKYSDNRRPDSVEYTRYLVDDLKRRDFTVNSMAYNHQVGLIDEFNGIDDMNNKIIRCVGNPSKRFQEDALRMIRAIRFSARLNFNIEDNTIKSIYENSNLIVNISKERIKDEVNKIILSDNPQKLYFLYDTKLFKYMGLHIPLIKEDDINILNKCKKDMSLRLTLYLNYINNVENSIDILKTLKYDNKNISKCKILLENINENILDNKKNIKIYLNKIGKDNLYDLIYLKKIYYDYFGLKEMYNHIDYVENILNEIIYENECYEIKSLKIDGNDLKQLGYTGPIVGEILNKLLHAVIEDPFMNEKQKLLNLLEKINL
jgi:tRNA nucleotidyltransferase (CCA-adding enzyme)